MKHKNFLIFGILLFGLCLVYLVGNKHSEVQKVTIAHQENIAQIQLNTIRISVQDYSSAKLDSLLKCIQDADPIEQGKSLQRNEDFMSVLFIYEDGSKEDFYFFEDDGAWYMEADDGKFYENAGFIEDYVNHEKAEVTAAVTISKDMLGIYLELLKDEKASDLETEISYHVAAYQKSGDSLEEALEKTEQMLIKRWKLFNYAEEEGFFLSEEEQAELMENYLSAIKSADDHEEYETLCSQAGTSLENVISKMKYSILENEVSNRFYAARRLEFMEGNDTVEGQVYNNLKEYHNAFLQQYVYEKEQESEKYKSFIKELEEAESMIALSYE